MLNVCVCLCVFYLCCCRPHYPCSLVLCVGGSMESCSLLMRFHQRYLDQNLRLQQHVCVQLQRIQQPSGYRGCTRSSKNWNWVALKDECQFCDISNTQGFGKM